MQQEPIEKTLLREIDAFCLKRKMSDHEFSISVFRHGSGLKRLRKGGVTTSKTINRARRFMANYTP